MILHCMASKILPFNKAKTIELRKTDRVTDVIKGIDRGRIKPGRPFSNAIRDFSCDELDRLSAELLYHYFCKFQ
jgi:hypothetical protein